MYDECNYDEASGRCCALAKAFDIPAKLAYNGVKPTQDSVLKLLKEEAGEAWGTVKGVPGEFYKDNREKDLKNLCKKILYDRFLESICPWTHYMCGNCNFWATHPVNYCPVCPGKINHVKVTWLEHIRAFRKKHRYLCCYFEQAGIKADYSSELIEHLRERLR